MKTVEAEALGPLLFRLCPAPPGFSSMLGWPANNTDTLKGAEVVCKSGLAW